MNQIRIEKDNAAVGFLPLLTVLFVGLKLTGFISWSWFWVLSPLLLPLIIALFCAVYFLRGKK